MRVEARLHQFLRVVRMARQMLVVRFRLARWRDDATNVTRKRRWEVDAVTLPWPPRGYHFHCDSCGFYVCVPAMGTFGAPAPGVSSVGLLPRWACEGCGGNISTGLPMAAYWELLRKKDTGANA